jgi:DNA repair protein RadC
MHKGKRTPHYFGHRQRLRERFAKKGLAGFADYQVVELLLRLAVPRSDIKKPAKKLIAGFGSLDASLDQVQKTDGIGPVPPVALRMIREAANLNLQRSVERSDCLIHHETLAMFRRAKIGALANEVFEVDYVDSECRLLREGVDTLKRTVDRATVYPRRVVESALRRNIDSLILAHNNPNSHVQPNEQDKVLTRALVLAATTVQIKVLHHPIVSPAKKFSFRREGLV